MRRLTFPKGFWRKPRDKQIDMARRRVREFMAETQGDVRIWGKAERFLFFHAKDAALVIAPSGKVVGDWQGGVPSRASLRVGHKTITARPSGADVSHE